MLLQTGFHRQCASPRLPSVVGGGMVKDAVHLITARFNGGGTFLVHDGGLLGRGRLVVLVPAIRLVAHTGRVQRPGPGGLATLLTIILSMIVTEPLRGAAGLVTAAVRRALLLSSRLGAGRRRLGFLAAPTVLILVPVIHRHSVSSPSLTIMFVLARQTPI